MARERDNGRQTRALTQRILLAPDGIDVLDDQNIVLRVIGASGTIYRVRFSSCSECTCPDFQNRLLTCKHIFFVLHRVLLISPSDLSASAQFTVEQTQEYVRFVQQVRLPQLSHITGERQEDGRVTVPPRPLSEQDECPVCLEEFEGEGEDLTYCAKTCGANFHSVCIRRCREKRCPLCRAENSSWPLRPRT